MKRLEVTPQRALVFLVSVLSFYGVWSVWTSLLYVESGFYDPLSLAMYGLVALSAAIALFAASRSTRYNRNERLAMLLAGLALLGMPFVFYYLRSPLLQKIALVIEWITSLGVCAGLFYISRSHNLERKQRIAMLAAAGLSFVAPFMPWFGWVFFSGRLFSPDVLPRGFWIYLGWAILIVWAWAAILMTGKLGTAPTLDRFVPITLKRMLIIGLCFFLLGILNPVATSSSTYEVKTYFGGQLTSTRIETLPDAMNLPLMAGALLTVLFAVFSGALSPAAKNNSGAWQRGGYE